MTIDDTMKQMGMPSKLKCVSLVIILALFLYIKNGCYFELFVFGAQSARFKISPIDKMGDFQAK
jgi:hypothetical protein